MEQVTVHPHAAPTDGEATAHRCACGDDDTRPELDARAIPHAIRHATIFGALGAIAPGGSLVLVAPHDPKPLLAQLAEREHGAFTVEYLERGPDAWRLLLTRQSASGGTRAHTG